MYRTGPSWVSPSSSLLMSTKNISETQKQNLKRAQIPPSCPEASGQLRPGEEGTGTPWFTASCPSRSYRCSHRGTGTGLVPEVTAAGLCCASCSSGGGTTGHVPLHPGMTPELMPVSRWTLISQKPLNLPAAPAVVRLLPRDTWGSNAQPCSLLQNQGQSSSRQYP